MQNDDAPLRDAHLRDVLVELANLRARDERMRRASEALAEALESLVEERDWKRLPQLMVERLERALETPSVAIRTCAAADGTEATGEQAAAGFLDLLAQPALLTYLAKKPQRVVSDIAAIAAGLGLPPPQAAPEALLAGRVQFDGHGWLVLCAGARRLAEPDAHTLFQRFLPVFAHALQRLVEGRRAEELARREHEILLAKEKAEAASRAKSEFVSRMSHELRTPLNAIIGFADLLEAEPLSPSLKNYVTLINGSGKHLLELINAVLDHAKIEAGGLTLERIPFDFHAAIDAVRAIVGDRASSKGLEFDARIAPDMPRYIVGDPTRLRQVLINLLVNAVKFTERGSVELRIATDDGRIHFSVRDTGIGMDGQALGRLFKPFSQADDTVTRKYGGTGLGLMISKELIEAMGGSIEVESAPGVGTVFWFSLPLRVAERGATDDVARTISQAGNVAALVPGKVLVVDDNRVNLQLACAMLDRLGIRHDTALDGIEALSRLASAEFALVLMDMEMPVMDGITATQQLRTRETELGASRVPVIAMTANALTEDRDRCFAAGMDGYIAKPINLAALQNELRRLFGASNDADEAPADETMSIDVPAAPLFDRVAAIDSMGDADLFKELAGMFVADVPNLVGELEAALAAADAPRLTRAAHTLKGLFATFASTPGETLARQLEHTARAGDLAACGELTTKVCVLARELAAALQA